MSILVVGSVALDSIQTPFGKVREALGGSATYFSIAARLYHQPVYLVAVVGADFPQAHMDSLKSHGVDIAGLQIAEGQTFRWSGRYDYDLNTAETLDTQLNVFASFHPRLPEEYRDAEYVFLANIDPVLQLEVLAQIRQPKLTVLDTMNYWISYRKEALTEAISAVDIVLVNEAEARQYANTFSLVRAANKILGQGPRALIVKKGEYGAVLFTRGADPRQGCFFAPAYPLEKINDPTGAGDSFAGGFMGHLAASGYLPGKSEPQTSDAIRRAIVHGSVVASYTVEDFGVSRLRSIAPADLMARYDDFKRFTYFEPVCPAADGCERLATMGGETRH